MIYNKGNISNFKKLDRLHKRILKVIFKISSTDVEKYMLKYRLLDLEKVYKLKVLCLGHRAIHCKDTLPKFLKTIYKPKENLSLRNKLDYITPLYRTVIGQRKMDYTLATEWNALPLHIKLIKKHIRFKKIIKAILNSAK